MKFSGLRLSRSGVLNPFLWIFPFALAIDLASAQYRAGQNIQINASPGTTPAIGVVPSPLFSGWSVLHTSSFGGCDPGNGFQVGINRAIAAASANYETGQEYKIAVDCGGSITDPIILPSVSQSLLIDAQFNKITVVAGYGLDVFLQPLGSQAKTGIINVNLVYTATISNPETAGAAFDMQNCDGCYIEHVRYSGYLNDLFDLGSNNSLTATSPPIYGGEWQHSIINDVVSNGGHVSNAAFRFSGAASNDIFSNYLLVGVPVQTPSAMPSILPSGMGVVADSSSMTPYTPYPIASGNYPDWHDLYFDNGDFEQMAGGFDFAINKGRAYDIYIQNHVVDTSASQPNLAITSDASTSPAAASHFHILDMWLAGGYSPHPVVKLEQSGSGQVYDVQFTGGHADNTASDALVIGSGVTGTEINGIQVYSTAGCAINDQGTDTVVTGSLLPGGLGISGAWGSNQFGICSGPAAEGAQYVTNDIRNDSVNGLTIAAGAGAASSIYVAGNNLAGYTGTSAIAIATPAPSASPASAVIVNNNGYAGSITPAFRSPIPCLLGSFVTQAGTLGCLDSGGNLGIAGVAKASTFTLQSKTQLSYGSLGHCGVFDTGFIFVDPPADILSVDSSGNVGICGALTTKAATINGTSAVPAMGQLTCTFTAGATSCPAATSVPTGTVCTASYDRASTAVVTSRLPLQVTPTGTSLTVTGYASPSVSTTPSPSFVFDYVCI